VVISLQWALVRPVALLRITADRESYREYMRLRESPHPGATGREVELRIGRLAGRPVWVREGTGDVDRVWDVFIDSPHLPPAKIQRRGLPLVWDVGARTGMASAEMALRWPEARVVAVVDDPADAALARRNVQPWDDRAEVVEAALTPESLNALEGPPAYVWIDAGGAARELITRDTGWADGLAAVKVRLAGDYTAEQCAADVERLGFTAKSAGDVVLGVR
jgi:hypothetical protein